MIDSKRVCGLKNGQTIIGISSSALGEISIQSDDTIREIRLGQLLDQPNINQVKLFYGNKKGHLFALLLRTGQLIDVDWLTSTIHQQQVIGQYPSDIAFACASNVIYVSETESSSIMALSGDDLTPIFSIPMFSQPIAVAYNNQYPAIAVAFQNRQRILLMDEERDQLYSQLKMEEIPTAIAYSCDYQYLFCLSYNMFGDGQLKKCDANTLKVREQLKIPILPQKLKLSYVGGIQVVVACGVGGVCVINAEEMNLMGWIEHEEVIDFAIDQGNTMIYVIDGYHHDVGCYKLIDGNHVTDIKTKQRYIGLIDFNY